MKQKPKQKARAEELAMLAKIRSTLSMSQSNQIEGQIHVTPETQNQAEVFFDIHSGRKGQIENGKEREAVCW